MKAYRMGFGVAIDDMGAGYASLQALVEVEPDYLKFDISLVRNIGSSVGIRATCQSACGRVAALVVARCRIDNPRPA